VLAAAAWVVAQESPGGSSDSTEAAPAVDAHRFSARFSPFEPLYGALGWRGRTNAKVQLSVKYRFASLDPDKVVGGNWFNKLYFGYTQVSLWDLEADSTPFYDNSFKPSFFFLHEGVGRWSEGRRSVDLQTGLEHESNGRDGEDSRSVNIVYVRPLVHFDRVFGGRFTVAPKVYGYIGGLSDNPDIADYRGYVDLELAWKDPDGWKLSAMLRKGMESSYGSVQVDASYPLDKIFKGSFDAFVHLQYFNGWGESLLSYNHKLPAQFRLGIMLVR
jgi:outer membrane phospholipase A